MSKKRKRVLGVIFIIAGLVLGSLGLMPLGDDRQAGIDAWKYVSGIGKTIEATATDVVQRTQTEGSRRTRTTTTMYCPVYTFTVNGKAYKAEAVGADCKNSQFDTMTGSKTTVIYDPSNPATAFVKSDASAAYYAESHSPMLTSLIIGGVLLVVGILVLIDLKPAPKKY